MLKHILQKYKKKRVENLSLLINNYLHKAEQLIETPEELKEISIIKEAGLKLNEARELFNIAKKLDYFPQKVYNRLGATYNNLLLRNSHPTSSPSFEDTIGYICKFLQEAGIAAS